MTTPLSSWIVASSLIMILFIDLLVNRGCDEHKISYILYDPRNMICDDKKKQNAHGMYITQSTAVMWAFNCAMM